LDWVPTKSRYQALETQKPPPSSLSSSLNVAVLSSRSRRVVLAEKGQASETASASESDLGAAYEDEVAPR
jgi:hypothetical protein